MKYFFLCLVLLGSSLTTFSQDFPTTYSRIQIDLRQTPVSAVEKLGLETDHGSYAPGKHLISDFSDQEIALLIEHNIPVSYTHLTLPTKRIV